MLKLRRLALLPLFGLLAACGTPQEQCIRQNTRDGRVLDRLIAESQATLNRGYALQQVEVPRGVWVPCGPPPEKGQRPRYCYDTVWDTETRPKSIDLDAERSKLRTMQAKRRELANFEPKVIAECKRLHPEDKK